MCNRKVVAKVFAVALVLSLSLSSAPAKDLTGHVGVDTAPITVGTLDYWVTDLSTDYALSARYFLRGGCLLGGCLAGPNRQLGIHVF